MIIKPKVGMFKGMFRGMGFGRSASPSGGPTIYMNETFDGSSDCGNDAEGCTNCDYSWTNTLGTNCTVDFNNTTHKEGTYGYQAVAASTGYRAQTRYDYSATLDTFYFGFYFYLNNVALGGAKLITQVRNATTYTLGLHIRGTDAEPDTYGLRVDGGGITFTSLNNINLQQWYHLETKYDYANLLWEVKLDGVTCTNGSGSITDGSKVADSRYFDIGWPSTEAYAGTIHFDDVTIADGWVGP